MRRLVTSRSSPVRKLVSVFMSMRASCSAAPLCAVVPAAISDAALLVFISHAARATSESADAAVSQWVFFMPRSLAAVLRGRQTSRLMDEPRHHVTVRPAHLHLRSGIEHQEAFAVGVRLHLPHEVEVDDGRTMHALETARVEPLLEVLHRLAEDERVLACLDAHIVTGGIDPLDGVD